MGNVEDEKKKPIKRTLKEKKKTQSERFIETARLIGADETGSSFENAFRKIIPQRNQKF